MRSALAFSFVLVLADASSANAGDMSAAVSGGSLVIKDSSTDDEITIDQAGLMNVHDFRVTPDAGTTVNGSAAPQVFTGVSKDIRIQHTKGADTDTFDGVSIARDLKVTGQQIEPQSLILLNLVHVGRDLVFDTKSDSGALSSSGAGSTVHRDLRVTGRGATNSLVVTPLHVLGDTRFKGAGGTDVFVVGANVKFVGDVEFNGAGGIDTFVDTATTVYGGKFKVRGSAAPKTIVLLGQVVGNVDIDVGSGGGKTIVIAGPQVGGSIRTKFGSGVNNVLTLSGTDVGGDVKCTSKGDVDTVSIGAATSVGGDVLVSLGAGANTLDIGSTNTIAGDVLFNGTSGHDVISIDQSVIWGDLRAKLGSAPTATSDTVTLIDTELLGDVDVKATAGDNGGAMDSAFVLGAVRLNFGSGNSSYVVDGCALGSLLAQGTNGNDDLTLTGGTLETIADARVLLGSGTNSIVIDHFLCGRDLIVRTGGGNDTITIAGATTTIVGETDIDLGGGINSGP